MNTKTNSLKKADILCLCIILAVCMLTLLYNFIGKSVSEGVNSSIPVFATAVVAVAIFFIPIPSKIKGFIYSLIIFAAAMVSLSQDPTDQGTFFTIAASIIILRLYYSSELIIAFAVIVNATFFILYFVNVEALFGRERPISFLLSALLMIDAVFIILYFSNRWGNQVIVKAAKKEKEVEELLTKIQSTFQKVEESSVVLNDNVANLDQSMDTIVKSSQETTRTMNEIAKGTENQAENIYNINTRMNEAIEEVNTTREISEKLSANSSLIAKKVSRGTEKINSMMDQMKTINEAVSAATSTVNELQTNIEHINGFLEGIAQISEQTNLLSLNASIESARAGEQGKGFAVVAGEVGKLAVQSAQTAKSIQEIIGIISQNSAAAVEKVGMGEKAVEVGNVVLGRVGDYFRDVETTIQETFEYLEKENTMINKILDQFIQVQEKIESIASISEEHTASNEEILATIENENNGIMAIKSSIQEIKKLSVVLNEMLHN